jgi:hypothetical protein
MDANSRPPTLISNNHPTTAVDPVEVLKVRRWRASPTLTTDVTALRWRQFTEATTTAISRRRSGLKETHRLKSHCGPPME